MISIDELKQRFLDIRDIKPYGFVVVVPGKEFDPDWEFQLEDQGYKVHLIDLDQKPVALVSCAKKPVEEGEKEVYAPPPPKPESRTQQVSKKQLMPMVPTTQRTPSNLSAMKGPVWTPKDEELLLKRMDELKGSLPERSRQIQGEFPGRSDSSLLQKYYKLKGPKPESKKKGGRRGPDWLEEETQKLVTLWNQGVLQTDIEAALPARSPKSIRSAIDRLRKAGKIQKRKVGRRRLRKVVEKEVQNSDKVADGEKREKVAKVAKVAERQSAETSPVASAELKRLTETLDRLVDVVDKLGCQAIMQALEIKEIKTPDFKIPLAIWNGYADALLREEAENRHRFRERVRKLLEAYS